MCKWEPLCENKCLAQDLCYIGVWCIVYIICFDVAFAIIIFYYNFLNTVTITGKKTLFLGLWALSLLPRISEIAFIA